MLADVLRTNGSLIRIGLHANSLGAGGAKVVVEALISNERSSVTALALAGNDLGSEGAKHIARGLASDGCRYNQYNHTAYINFPLFHSSTHSIQHTYVNSPLFHSQHTAYSISQLSKLPLAAHSIQHAPTLHSTTHSTHHTAYINSPLCHSQHAATQ
jgi:hypothetical protein